MNKKVFSHQTNSPEKVMQKRDNVRPRVPSTTRRNALGWTKRSAKASSELKENNSFGQSMGLTSNERENLASSTDQRLELLGDVPPYTSLLDTDTWTPPSAFLRSTGLPSNPCLSSPNDSS
ncbi:hypothetical protein F5878DRAFT_666811 [Lentinula raphanica]|uniref:Uncharacterized protein n=1 Tax=Lentinula raphanica TaxID=153919 RepID=A0AA38NWZ3_9AGAR|nr:hypothetical protein F5878DRAFT_666811 [Lentinula raphanica]